MAFKCYEYEYEYIKNVLNYMSTGYFCLMSGPRTIWKKVEKSPPEILLHRIQTNLGIGGTAQTWLVSYLADLVLKVMIIAMIHINPSPSSFWRTTRVRSGPTSFLRIYPTYYGYHQNSWVSLIYPAFDLINLLLHLIENKKWSVVCP